MSLAENEAIKRGIDPKTIEGKAKIPGTKSMEDEEISWASTLADILSGLS